MFVRNSGIYTKSNMSGRTGTMAKYRWLMLYTFLLSFFFFALASVFFSYTPWWIQWYFLCSLFCSCVLFFSFLFLLLFCSFCQSIFMIFSMLFFSCFFLISTFLPEFSFLIYVLMLSFILLSLFFALIFIFWLSLYIIIII